MRNAAAPPALMRLLAKLGWWAYKPEEQARRIECPETKGMKARIFRPFICVTPPGLPDKENLTEARRY